MDIFKIPSQSPDGDEALVNEPENIQPQHGKNALIAIGGISAGALGATIGTMLKPGTGTFVGYFALGQGVYLFA